jgi:hypothetical protein
MRIVAHPCGTRESDQALLIDHLPDALVTFPLTIIFEIISSTSQQCSAGKKLLHSRLVTSRHSGPAIEGKIRLVHDVPNAFQHRILSADFGATS